MSVEEQIDRMRRHQSGSMKEKRRSLQLPPSPAPEPSPRPAYKVVMPSQLPTGMSLASANTAHSQGMASLGLGGLRGKRRERTQTGQLGEPESYLPYRQKSPSSVRRHRSIHEVDISNLEAALRAEEPGGRTYETPREEIARLRKMELEPQHYDVDINKELSTPDKVLIPERYIDLEPDTPLSPEELKEKQKKVERIKTLIAKSRTPGPLEVAGGTEPPQGRARRGGGSRQQTGPSHQQRQGCGRWVLVRPASSCTSHHQDKTEGSSSADFFPLQGCPKCSLEPLNSFENIEGRGPNLCFSRVPLTPRDSLAGNQRLHILGALALPANLSPQAPPSHLDHPVPPSISVCLCLFSMQNVVPIGEGDSVDVPQDSESQLQEQEKRIEISCALATEASRRGRMLSGERGWASLHPARETSRPGVGEEAWHCCKGGRSREI
ncbi:hypothetical protein P7K49_035764 [Saguinus oedipus]|uniref:Pleckstrin homology domain-containing family A member 6 n=1 Tax=Saguinus oedipus TaxID=9490 RepID=A0ABQ9TNK8_SAGOE|nr:hypothetical protein P7K49_035764 [Saguinus oedipus]